MSLAYHLLGKGFSGLDAFECLHWFQSGEVQLGDPNEMGAQGSLLHALLTHGDVSFRQGSLDKDPSMYEGDVGIERLGLWLIQRGANPWEEGGAPSLRVWKHVLQQGHAGLMKAMAAHGSAPESPALEAVDLAQEHSNYTLSAPSWFAQHNQIEALRAWAALGLDVNLGNGKGGPGSRARTPEFLKAWAEVGGDLTALHYGSPLPTAWSHFAGAKKIQLERVWLAHQTTPALSQEEAIHAVLEQLADGSFKRKTLAEIHFLFNSLGVKWSSALPDGTTLQALAREQFFKNPGCLSASQGRQVFHEAPPETYLQAVVAGLKMPPSTKAFPASLLTVLESKVLGAPAEAAAQVATALLDAPLVLGRALRSFSSEFSDEDLPFQAWLSQWILADDTNAKWVGLAQVLGQHSHAQVDYLCVSLTNAPELQSFPWVRWVRLFSSTRGLAAALGSQPEMIQQFLEESIFHAGVGTEACHGNLTVQSAFVEAVCAGISNNDSKGEAWKNEVAARARECLLGVVLPPSAESKPKPRF